jgi:hypothetical protein
VGGDHNRRCVPGCVSRGAVERAVLAPPFGLEEEAEGMRNVVKLALVSDLHRTGKCMVLTKGRLLPLVGGRFSTYMRFMGNEDGGSDGLGSTIALNASLLVAAIFATNFLLMINMRRSSSVQEPGTQRWQNEASSAVPGSVAATDEEIFLGEEGLGPAKSLPLTSPAGYGLPKAPAPVRTSSRGPLPTPGSVVPEPPTRPLLAQAQNSLPPPSPSRPRPQPLTSWSSRSTLQERWDGGSANSVHGMVPPPHAWSI